MRDYMLMTYVQLGADYQTSRCSAETVERAHDFIELFMNGVGIGKVALASSTTVLCAMLAEWHSLCSRFCLCGMGSVSSSASADAGMLEAADVRNHKLHCCDAVRRRASRGRITPKNQDGGFANRPASPGGAFFVPHRHVQVVETVEVTA